MTNSTDNRTASILSSAAAERTRSAFGAISGPSARKGAATLADQAIVSGTNFLAGVAVGRYCTTGEFGLYTLCFSLLVLVMNIQNALIATPYIVFSPRLSGEELEGANSRSLVHQVWFSGLVAAGLFLAGAVLPAGLGPAGMSAVLYSMGAVIPFLLFREYTRQVSFAWLRPDSAFLADLAVAAVFLGGIYLLVDRGVLSAARTFIVSGAACALAAAGWFLRYRRRFPFCGDRRPPLDFRREWEFGKWPLAGGITYLAGSQLYLWTLAGFHGTSATGMLSACASAVYLANPFIIGIGNFLCPRIMHAYGGSDAPGARRIVRTGIAIVAGVLGPFCLLLMTFGDTVVQTIYGAKYAGYGLAVGLLALSQLVETITLPLGFELYAVGRPDVSFRSNAAALIVTVTAGVPLTMRYKVVGAAVGLLAASVASSAYRWAMHKRHIPGSGPGNGRMA